MTTNSELESQTWQDRIAQMSKAVPGIPCAAIYSNSDGIVSPAIAREPQSPITENIRVVASHLGLGFSAAVLFAIADRLAQPEGNWQPFDKRGWRRMVYA